MVLCVLAPVAIFPSTIKSIRWVKSSDELDFHIELKERVAYSYSDLTAEKGYCSVELANISANYGSNWIDVDDVFLSKVKVDSGGNRLRFIFYPQVLVRFQVTYDDRQANLLHVKLSPIIKKSRNYFFPDN